MNSAQCENCNSYCKINANLLPVFSFRCWNCGYKQWIDYLSVYDYMFEKNITLEKAMENLNTGIDVIDSEM